MPRFEYSAQAVVWAPTREEADATVNGWLSLNFDGGYISLDDSDPTVENDEDES